MMGDLDPKTCRPFTEEHLNWLQYTTVHNLLHNSEANADNIDGVLLPPGKACVNDCIMDELKKMVIARGGNLTGRDGKAIPSNQLKRLVRANLLLEKENSKHTVYFQRAKTDNGIFTNFDTSERKSIRNILQQHIDCSELTINECKFLLICWSCTLRGNSLKIGRLSLLRHLRCLSHLCTRRLFMSVIAGPKKYKGWAEQDNGVR